MLRPDRHGRGKRRVPLKKPSVALGLLYAFRPVLGDDAGDVQLGGSGDTADDRATARARWEVAGYASGYDNRTSLILFRHPGVNALVQCGILHDVTRATRTVVSCYELR